MRELERIWESVGSEQEVWGSQSEIYIAKFGDFSSHGAKLRMEKMINIKMAKSRSKHHFLQQMGGGVTPPRPGLPVAPRGGVTEQECPSGGARGPRLPWSFAVAARDGGIFQDFCYFIILFPFSLFNISG